MNFRWTLRRSLKYLYEFHLKSLDEIHLNKISKNSIILIWTAHLISYEAFIRFSYDIHNVCYLDKPLIKSWNKTRRHKMLMACKLCLCYTWHSQRLYLNNNNFHGWEGDFSEPSAPTFPLRLRTHDLQHFKTKTVWHFPSLAPCEVFSNNFTPYLC